MSRLRLPSFDEVVAGVALAEQAEGWAARCDDAGRYIALTRELVTALAAALRSLGGGAVLEVCAGDGSLAHALRGRGLAVTATDAWPPSWGPGGVEALSAAEALRRYPHPVVLGTFVPGDADVDRCVLAAPHVLHYVVLNARLGLAGGCGLLPPSSGWRSLPLPEVSRWMVTRHDGWLGDHVPILRRGDAWLLSRLSPRSRGCP